MTSKRKRKEAKGPVVLVGDLDTPEAAFPDSSTNFPEDTSTGQPDSENLEVMQVPPFQNRVELLPPNQFPFCTDASQKFFHHNQLPGGGISYLAGLAGLGFDCVGYGEIDPLQVKMIGLSYLEWFLEQSSEETEYNDLLPGQITSYLLLLPYLQGKLEYEDPGYKTNTFAAVLSDHSTLTPDVD
jgi:hypothetical protein